MGGRPAKSVKVQSGVLSEADAARRREIEEKVRGSADKLQKPPAYLTKRQKAVWKWIVKELDAAAILSNLDAPLLELASIALDRIRMYDDMIREAPEGKIDSKLIRDRNVIVQEWLRYCNELCLSPQSRAKLGTISVTTMRESTDPIKAALGL